MTSPDWLEQIDQYFYRVQRQDKLALKELYDLAGLKVLSLIRRIINDQGEAEDVLQEVFVKLWQQSKKYTGRGSAWGWICVLARHSAIDRLRYLKTRGHESTDESPELLDRLSVINGLDDNHWVGKCLEELKLEHRQAVLLSYIKGYSHKELSENLSAPLGTVKTWVRRGLQELKQCLTA